MRISAARRVQQVVRAQLRRGGQQLLVLLLAGGSDAGHHQVGHQPAVGPADLLPYHSHFPVRRLLLLSALRLLRPLRRRRLAAGRR